MFYSEIIKKKLFVLLNEVEYFLSKIHNSILLLRFQINVSMTREYVRVLCPLKGFQKMLQSNIFVVDQQSWFLNLTKTIYIYHKHTSFEPQTYYELFYGRSYLLIYSSSFSLLSLFCYSFYPAVNESW